MLIWLQSSFQHVLMMQRLGKPSLVTKILVIIAFNYLLFCFIGIDMISSHYTISSGSYNIKRIITNNWEFRKNMEKKKQLDNYIKLMMRLRTRKRNKWPLCIKHQIKSNNLVKNKKNPSLVQAWEGLRCLQKHTSNCEEVPLKVLVDLTFI